MPARTKSKRQTTINKEANKRDWSFSNYRIGLKNDIARLLILLSLSCSWLLITISSAAAEFSYHDGVFITGITAAVLGAQSLLFALWRVFHRASAAWWLPLFAVANLMSFYVFFIHAVSVLPGWQLAGLILLALFIAFAFFAFLGELRARALVVAAVIVGVFVVQFSTYLWQHRGYTVNPMPAGQTSAAEVNFVRFQQTPNVYLISFDAMAPEPILREYFEMDSLPYQQWMRDKGFRLFRNAFSDGSGTKPTLNRVLALHPAHFRRLAGEQRHYDLFNGLSPAPLFELFKGNGYRTHTYYRNSYFGKRSGPHVDSYNILFPFSICYNHPTTLSFQYGIYGFCQLLRTPTFMRLWGMEDKAVGGYPPSARFVEFAFADIARRLATERSRQLFVVHIGSPDHAPPNFDYDDPAQYNAFHQRFSALATHEVPVLMEAIFNFIRQSDPSGIVLYYADHGLYLTMKDIKKDFSTFSPAKQRFHRLDGYGILMGLYPPTLCIDYLNVPPRPYANITMVLRQLLTCLSGGDDPMPGFNAYGFYEEFGSDRAAAYQGDEPGSYEDYLYE